MHILFAIAALSTGGVIVPIIVAIFVSMTAPMILALWNGHQRRVDKKLDYAREDARAKQDEEIADKLEMIHLLVNSKMTSEIEGRLEALRHSLTLMREIVELKEASGIKPTPQVLRELAAIHEEIADLDHVLATRISLDTASDRRAKR